MKLPRMEITKDGGKEVCVKVVGVEVGRESDRQVGCRCWELTAYTSKYLAFFFKEEKWKK